MKKITVDTDVLIDILTSKKIPEGRRQASVELVRERIEFGDYIGYICFHML